MTDDLRDMNEKYAEHISKSAKLFRDIVFEGQNIEGCRPDLVLTSFAHSVGDTLNTMADELGMSEEVQADTALALAMTLLDAAMSSEQGGMTEEQFRAFLVAATRAEKGATRH